MAEQNNLIIEHLKAIRNELAVVRSEMREDFKDVKSRLTAMEHGLAALVIDGTKALDPQ